MAIEPKTKVDQEKMGNALQRLSEEDPTFRVFTNVDTGQTIIAGMGELHLEIIRDRMMREFKVDANSGKPQIAYRETITAPATGEGKLIKQSGGRGQYGHVIVNVTPNERGKGLTIENKVIGGTIPKEYIPACKKGIEEAVLNGIVGGYPVVDVNVDIIDGSYHDVDSNEMAFKLAAIFAVKDGFKKAKAILLEPIMKVEVETPEDYQGDIMGDLSRRRAQLNGTEMKSVNVAVAADVPLAEMFGYATAIRSLSKGRASYTMEPSHFAQVPANVLAAVLDQKETSKRRRSDPSISQSPRPYLLILWQTANVFASASKVSTTGCSTSPAWKSWKPPSARARRWPARSRCRRRSKNSPSTAPRTWTRSRWSSSRSAPTSVCSTSSSRPPRPWTS